MESTFRGVFLTCTDAEATAAFYRKIAGLPLTTEGDEEYSYFVVEAGGVQLALHSAEAFADYAFPPVAESNLTHLYFRIPDQAEFLERIKNAGTPLVAVTGARQARQGAGIAGQDGWRGKIVGRSARYRRADARLRQKSASQAKFSPSATGQGESPLIL